MDAAASSLPFQVEIQIASDGCALPEQPAWKSWVVTALDMAGSEVSAANSMTIRLVDVDEGRDLNKRYRNKDSATNVLAFPGADPHADFSGEFGELGDLVICLPIAYEEARQQAKPPLAHLAHLVVHGTLHLIGFDHQDDIMAGEMEELETRIMRRLGFPDPYAER